MESEEMGGVGQNGVDSLCNKVEMKGTVKKWTNYIHGWQDRYVVVRNSVIVYYKNPIEVNYGCRGAINLEDAIIKVHQLDECRFDVQVTDCVWYLRVSSLEERLRWLQTIEANSKSNIIQAPNLLQSETSLNALSIGGDHVSLTEVAQKIDLLRQKFAIETKKMGNLIDSYELDKTVALDLKTHVSVLQTTSDEIYALLGSVVDNLVGQENEESKNKMYRRISSHIQQPDFEEGPHSQIGEEEFFDALETTLDKLRNDQDFKDRLLEKQSNVDSNSSPSSLINSAVRHPLWSEIDRVSQEQLRYARMEVEDIGSVWELFASDGEMKMFRREEEIDGMVMDPLKAMHQVDGVTAYELCHYFFSPSVRMEWEITVESANVLQVIAADTVIFHQVHTRVWPTTQRDSLFWSHIRRVGPDSSDPKNLDTWMVCNHSTEHPEAPNPQRNNLIRLGLTVCFVCDTIVKNSSKDNKQPLTRNDISCRMTYCSVINPGGWAPHSALRYAYKREYPRFLKRFTHYVIEKTKNIPIQFEPKL